MRKKYVISGFFVLIIMLALLTNPTKDDYMEFWKNKFEEEISI